MAKRTKPSRPAAPKRLEDLPQRFDLWEADARQLSASVRVGEGAVSPWMTVVVSRTDGAVLAMDLAEDAPAVDQVWDVLERAMRAPEGGEPHRPNRVLVRREEWQAALAARLQPLGIECATEAELEETDTVFTGLGDHLAQINQPMPGLLDMPGMTPEAVGSFFDAAAQFYQHAPWRKVGERPIEVRCEKFESGPWYAVLLGQGGMARGLILYDDLQTLQRVQRGDLSEEENARMTSALAVMFGEDEDLPQADLDAIRHHGWHVPTPDAYPAVYRMEPGLNMRPPLTWELTLLEGCLRALPEFARKKTRRLEPLTLDVPTGAGPLPVALAWAAE